MWRVVVVSWIEGLMLMLFFAVVFDRESLSASLCVVVDGSLSLIIIWYI